MNKLFEKVEGWVTFVFITQISKIPNQHGCAEFLGSRIKAVILNALWGQGTQQKG